MKCQGKWAWAGGIHFKQMLRHQNPQGWNWAEKPAVLQEGLPSRGHFVCGPVGKWVGKKPQSLVGCSNGPSRVRGAMDHGCSLSSCLPPEWECPAGFSCHFTVAFWVGVYERNAGGKISPIHTFRDQKESYLILMKTPLSISWTLSHGQGLARIWDYLPWGDGCVFCVGIRDPRVPKEAKIIVDQPTFHNFPGNWVEAPDVCCQGTGRGRKGSGRVRKSQWDSAMSLFPRHWPWMFQGPDHEATRCMPLRKGETTLKFFNKDTFFHVKSRDKV